jgi:equilibrative nucleoside transporter 1/2/3
MEIDKFTKITFVMNGISSLLGWNVILSAFDFFQNSFPGRDVTNYFPIPLFVAYVMTGLVYNKMQKMFAYKKMIAFGLILTNAAIVAALVVSLALKDTTIGYAICLILMWIVGAAGNITQLSFFAIINYLSANIVSIFTVGTALSMMLTTVVRIIILAIMGPESDNLGAIIIYIGVGGVSKFC